MSLTCCIDCGQCLEGEDELEQNEHGEKICPYCGEETCELSEDPPWR